MLLEIQECPSGQIGCDSFRIPMTSSLLSCVVTLARRLPADLGSCSRKKPWIFAGSLTTSLNRLGSARRSAQPGDQEKGQERNVGIHGGAREKNSLGRLILPCYRYGKRMGLMATTGKYLRDIPGPQP